MQGKSRSSVVTRSTETSGRRRKSRDGLLSVVIPTLEEEKTLVRLLDDLKRQVGVELEVIVTDGGSDDDTAFVARRGGAKVVVTGVGRGRQMNAGARLATGETLLFLHADTQVGETGLLRRALRAFQEHRGAHLGVVAGHFRLKFACENGECDWVYGFLEGKSGLNRAYTFNGDQGLMIAADDFVALGGFDESRPFLEDQEIGAQVRACGEWVTLPGTITTSARRFEREGFWERYALMAVVMGAYVTGVDEVFEALPEIYRAQKDAERLDLAPFLRGVWGVFGGLEAGRREEVLKSLVGLGQENVWQLFFGLDVLGIWPRNWLGFYDAVVREWVEDERWRGEVVRMVGESLELWLGRGGDRACQCGLWAWIVGGGRKFDDGSRAREGDDEVRRVSKV